MLVAAIIVLLMIIMAAFADQIVPYDPNKISIRERTQGPSAAHWLGTDEFGRDVLSRIIVGSQVSLVVGVLAVIIACIIGTAFGMIAGYFGGVVDDVINRISEAIRVIPQVVLAIALCAVFGLMLKHVLPNSISPIIVTMTQQIGNTILSEAGLSFLGLGISQPTASWGSLVSGGRDFLLTNPVYSLAPGICIALLVICLNTLGDGIRDALAPRLRGEL